MKSNNETFEKTAGLTRLIEEKALKAYQTAASREGKSFANAIDAHMKGQKVRSALHGAASKAMGAARRGAGKAATNADTISGLAPITGLLALSGGLAMYNKMNNKEEGQLEKSAGLTGAIRRGASGVARGASRQEFKAFDRSLQAAIKGHGLKANLYQTGAKALGKISDGAYHVASAAPRIAKAAPYVGAGLAAAGVGVAALKKRKQKEAVQMNKTASYYEVRKLLGLKKEAEEKKRKPFRGWTAGTGALGVLTGTPGLATWGYAIDKHRERERDVREGLEPSKKFRHRRPGIALGAPLGALTGAVGARLYHPFSSSSRSLPSKIAIGALSGAATSGALGGAIIDPITRWGVKEYYQGRDAREARLIEAMRAANQTK